MYSGTGKPASGRGGEGGGGGGGVLGRNRETRERNDGRLTRQPL